MFFCDIGNAEPLVPSITFAIKAPASTGFHFAPQEFWHQYGGNSSLIDWMACRRLSRSGRVSKRGWQIVSEGSSHRPWQLTLETERSSTLWHAYEISNNLCPSACRIGLRGNDNIYYYLFIPRSLLCLSLLIKAGPLLNQIISDVGVRGKDRLSLKSMSTAILC